MEILQKGGVREMNNAIALNHHYYYVFPERVLLMI